MNPAEDHLVAMIVAYVALVLAVLLFFLKKKTPTVGMPVAYTFNLFMYHFFGGLIYAFPWWQNDNYENVYLGFRETLYGMAAFAFGTIVLVPFFVRHFLTSPKSTEISPPINLPSRYLLIGLLFYIVGGKCLVSIPSIATFVQSGWYLLLTAVCLFCWKAWLKGEKWKVLLWIAVSMLFPFFTTFNSGFLGLGTVALMSILFFVSVFFKPRWLIIPAILLSIYMGLSLCVTYFRDRGELREALWYNQASKTESIERTMSTLSNFEFLDFFNEKHLIRIDGRLNQNTQVGKCIIFMRDGGAPFAHGETLWEAVTALIPRILWPGKPVLIGTTDEVTKYTGEVFNDSTTVSMGQVMEFYVNFGTPGVIICYLIFSVVVFCFDYKASAALLRGDWKKFTFWFLPGLGFMLSIDGFVSITGSVVSAMIFCFLIHRYLLKSFLPKARRTRVRGLEKKFLPKT